MKAIGVRPSRGDFALPDAEIIKPGDPRREHPVLPHGEVRPRSDAAPRLRPTGRNGPGRHRAMDRRDGPGRNGRTGPRTAGRRTLVDQPEVGDAAGAKARPRRAGPRRASARCWPRPGSSRTARSATCSRAICHRTGGRSGSSARTRGPGPSWPSTATPAGGRGCSGRSRTSAAVATGSATGARRSGRTYRRSESSVLERTCWTASWSRRAGSSRSTPPTSPRRPTAVR